MTLKIKDTHVDTYRVLKHIRKVLPKPLNNFARFIVHVKEVHLSKINLYFTGNTENKKPGEAY